MSRSTVGRLALMLPEALSVALTGKDVRAARVIAAGMRLGGIFAWGIEQARFSQELAGPGIADRNWRVSFPHLPPPALPGIEIAGPLPVTDTAIVGYQAAGPSGEPLTLLVSKRAEKEAILTDSKMVERMVGLIPRPLPQIPRTDLIGLIEDIAAVAAVEAELAQEVDGMRLGAETGWFEVPRVVSQYPDALIVTALPGFPVSVLPEPQREAVYQAAVLGWGSMLLRDGIVQVGLRRDRVLLQDGRLGITRWAGTRRAGEASIALMRSLMLAAFGTGPLIRAEGRDEAAELLAGGLGLTGGLAQIEEFCLSLISEPGRLDRASWQLSEMAVREREGYSRAGRTEILLVLRQLIWLRDLGLECGSGDLTAPWRELAAELRGM